MTVRATKYVGRPRTRVRQQVFRTKGTVCYLCGHEGSTEVDHLEPDGDPLAIENMAPAHGSSAPCPYCGRSCNQEKGDRPLTAMSRLVTSQDWYVA